ncbi:MAG: triose-phosphate isomerase [Pelagibacterales bacterium MED-G40]|nr:MAG: triose-phosphate isomerase [Pelagibacterales bacterium MED-G40]|tara:strand:- start:538 stop:1299 length:762 start_codon:yes stop_codon:yes gene_type:complete
MANNMRYFIGNWKMFGVPKSINILNKINAFAKSNKSFNKNYKIIITPPFTLIETFAKLFKKKSILIGGQNCYHRDYFGSNTGSVSPFMLKKIGATYVIIGHSDNRAEGDTSKILKNKVIGSLNNNLKIVFCIGENKKEKAKKLTFKVLKSQLTKVLEKKFNKNNIIVAYEPIWSIGTGKIPKSADLKKISKFIKKVLKSIFKTKESPKVLYGGSVDSSNIASFKFLDEIDGFLIGGASKSSKKFIDIIKNYYR